MSCTSQAPPTTGCAGRRISVSTSAQASGSNELSSTCAASFVAVLDGFEAVRNAEQRTHRGEVINHLRGEMMKDLSAAMADNRAIERLLIQLEVERRMRLSNRLR